MLQNYIFNLQNISNLSVNMEKTVKFSQYLKKSFPVICCTLIYFEKGIA